MRTWIALFRGINMIGMHILPMKELILLLKGLGAYDIKTYHQSGNVVFRHRGKDAAKLAKKIGAAINKQYGFEPWVLLLEVEEFKRIVKENPFPEGVQEPELCVFFLSSEPEHPNLNAMEAVKKDSERFALRGKVFYLHAPEGTYRSKLAGRIERYLGVPMSGRAWSTIEKVMVMVNEME
ncbi:MAG: DUF1697 domain-containing protein [Bacteroidota bacterium]